MPAEQFKVPLANSAHVGAIERRQRMRTAVPSTGEINLGRICSRVASTLVEASIFWNEGSGNLVPRKRRC